MFMLETPLLLAALILQAGSAAPASHPVAQCGAAAGLTPHQPVADCCVHLANWTPPTNHTPSAQPDSADERSLTDAATR